MPYVTTGSPHTNDNNYMVGKNPVHCQVVLDVGGGKKIYVPVKNFNWDKTTESVMNLHSGSPLPSDDIHGHQNYKVTFETGTWLTTEANKEVAEEWEYLTYKYLVRPHDQGRSRRFDVIFKQSSYYDDDYEIQQGGATATIIQFWNCKINHMTGSMGENGINKRTYEANAMRMVYGTGHQEEAYSP
jgi:hypothetical protein